jgi:hypothetical protein
VLESRYRVRTQLAESPADADKAVGLAREAIELASRHHPLRPVLHTTLIAALLVRHNVYADSRDLAEALRLATAADAPVLNGPAPAVTGQRIATAVTLGVSASADAGSPDLDHAIDLLRTATSEIADASPGKPMLAQTLSTALQNRHIAQGSSADLDSAIEVARYAVGLEAKADPQRQARALMLLAGLLSARYEDAGDPADIGAALRAGQDAVELVPPEALPATAVHKWAQVLLLKHGASGEAADLEEAIRILRHLVASTTTPALARTSATVDLAQALLRRPPTTPGLTWMKRSSCCDR